eukprot:Opistho-1_new@13527
MGQTLSEPVTEKHTTKGSDHRMLWAASCMQGWRVSMEDAHTTLLRVPGDEGASFFAVYDGHGGAKVAKYAGEWVHTKIVNNSEYMKGNYEAAIQNGFLKADEDMLTDASMKNVTAGSTAVCILIKDKKIYCGNAGDSRCVLSSGGVQIPLSFDHKPINEGESQRITAAGGFVEFGRVNGNLALSRAIGDFEFKTNPAMSAQDQIVTVFPEVITKPLTEREEFIVLACDGIWDVMSNQDVVDFIRSRIARLVPLEKIVEELLDACLAPESHIGGVGCDNMTAVIVAFLPPGGTYEDLAKKCAQSSSEASN